MSNRDREFLLGMWRSTFHHLEVALHYTTAHHPSAIGQVEQTNQTVEIALRLALMNDGITDFTELLPSIQSFHNNSVNASTGFAPNEIIYGFKVAEPADLLVGDVKDRADDDNSPTTIEEERENFRKEVAEAISAAQALQKIRYDPRHTLIKWKEGDRIYIKLHKSYNQPDMRIKFDKQRVGPTEIIEKMRKVAYRLKLQDDWKIHSINSIIQLKPYPEDIDPYEREI